MKNENYKTLMFNSKRGINDVSILAIFIFIFFATALVIPFINAEFGTSASNLNTEGITDEIQQEASSVTTISAFGVILTILKLAFFDFGNTLGLPFWLDGVYTVLATLFIFLIARNIWVGGGG